MTDKELAFLSFVAKILKVNSESLEMESAYGSIGEWDSIMHLRLVMEIEAEYDVEIPMEDIPVIKTLADFFKYIE